jgi:hypothetical protein
MNGRKFLDVARAAVEDPSEEWQRTAMGRVYYALFLECRDAIERWGFVASSTYQAHAVVRNRLLATNHADLKYLGRSLDDLFKMRAHPDYDLTMPPIPTFQIELNIDLAEDGVALLDEIESDPAKRAAVVAALQGVP